MMLRVGGKRIASAVVAVTLVALLGCAGDDAAESAGDTAATDEAAPEASAATTRTDGTASTHPDETASEGLTLGEALSDDPNLTVFGRLIETARLESELAREGELTLFVPNNAAFALIPEGTVAGEAAAREIVLRHVASGSWDSGTFSARESIRSLSGSPITLESRDGSLVVGEGAQVVSRDRRRGDLTIHVISRVLSES